MKTNLRALAKPGENLNLLLPKHRPQGVLAMFSLFTAPIAPSFLPRLPPLKAFLFKAVLTASPIRLLSGQKPAGRDAAERAPPALSVVR
jgi:hypothetical protein